MVDGKFDVVFRGQIVKFQDEAVVKENLVKLFKSTPAAIERLFCGSEVTIRKGLDYAAAMKYQSALKGAGALALIKEVEDQDVNINKEAAATSDQAQQTPPQPVEPSVNSHSQSPEDSSNQPNNANDIELTVAAAGAQILPPKVYEKREVDTSELTLAQPGERILPESSPQEYSQPSIDHLSLKDNV